MLNSNLQNSPIFSIMKGLYCAGAINKHFSDESAYVRGRHHVSAAISQIASLGVIFEELNTVLTMAKFPSYSYPLQIVNYVFPLGVAYLAGRQIKKFHISRGANFLQEHLSKLNLVTLAVSSIALFILGQQFTAAAALLYLSVGLLSRNSLLSEPLQKVVQQADFIIGNIGGLYFGGTFIKILALVDLVSVASKKYFDYQRSKQPQTLPPVPTSPSTTNVVNSTVSWDDLKDLEDTTPCTINRSHIHQKDLPPVDQNVRIDDLLILSNKIDWKKHEKILINHLNKDRRWQEIGRLGTPITPIDFFKNSLREFVGTIRDKKISHGRPVDYTILEHYCRYIAQELKNKDEIIQADCFILLGVDGGKYCGAGKFEVVEFLAESFILQGEKLPLDVRFRAVLKQERVQIWQNIYSIIMKSNPIYYAMNNFTGTNAVHNYNEAINLVQAGEKFGIPHEGAKNDTTATIRPVVRYMCHSVSKLAEDGFWNGEKCPQWYFSMEKPSGLNILKPWKWVKVHLGFAHPQPYNLDSILDSLRTNIGRSSIPVDEVYAWWARWIDRQTDLTDEKKEKLHERLTGYDPKKRTTIPPSLDEPLEFKDRKIRPKFLIAMLIEMGILEHPFK